jgi:hypothetical protein
MSRLNIDIDRDLIIPRALLATTPSTFASDIEKLEAIYPKAVIARELKAATEKVSNVKQFLRFSK